MARKKLHVNPSNEQGCVKNSTQLSRRRFFIFYYFVWAPAQGSLKIKITTAAVNYNGPAAAEWLILLLFTSVVLCCGQRRGMPRVRINFNDARRAHQRIIISCDARARAEMRYVGQQQRISIHLSLSASPFSISSLSSQQVHVYYLK